MSMYSARGVRTVLVTCTGGEAGDVGDAALLQGRSLASARAAELEEATRILGYESVHTLGYRDSGMDASDEAGFASIDIGDVVERLVRIFDIERPDVVVTYDAEYARGHPDHERCHEATVAAFDRAAGEDWAPAKLYGTRTHTPGRLAAMHNWLVANDLPSPYEEALARSSADPTTSRVHVGDHLEVARRALAAHRSQVAPDEPWFFAVPVDALRQIHPWDDYVLLRPAVAIDSPPSGYEDDLFAGIDDTPR